MNTLQQQAHAKILQCHDVLTSKGIIIPEPTVTFNLRGSVGGYAFLNDNHVQLNDAFLQHYGQRYIESTCVHELAHLGAHAINQSADGIHGRTWRKVMGMLGVNDPTRCHTYDVSVANPSWRTVQCVACSRTYQLSPKRLTGLASLHCRSCGSKRGKLTLLPPTQPVVEPQVVARAGTKMEACIAVYTANQHRSRGEILALFVNQVGMSPAGASTYYAKIKSSSR